MGVFAVRLAGHRQRKCRGNLDQCPAAAAAAAAGADAFLQFVVRSTGGGGGHL